MEKLNELLDKADSLLLGKRGELKMALTSVICGGHLLLEDVPGVGKTTLVYLFSKLFGLKLNRIQFTNDLLPGDILGTTIFKSSSEEFEFIQGPIFGEMILADELNRATPKTQSALLQVMEERRVTIEAQTYELPREFCLIATQNPNFQIGTYPLPESQLDRFFMSLYLDFPKREYEKKILAQGDLTAEIEALACVVNKEELKIIQAKIEKQEVSEAILDYLLDVISFGRQELQEGSYLSPRASKDLLKAAKAHSYLEKRSMVLPEDIQAVAPHVLGHRLSAARGTRYGHGLIQKLLTQVPVVG
jgi:MoxR-like ATPase